MSLNNVVAESSIFFELTTFQFEYFTLRNLDIENNTILDDYLFKISPFNEL